jgi:hypothetical protein
MTFFSETKSGIARNAPAAQEVDITDAPRAEPAGEAADSVSPGTARGAASGVDMPVPSPNIANKRRHVPEQRQPDPVKVSKWVFLCFPPLRSGLTEYEHQPIHDVDNDTQLFEAMQSKYKAKRGRSRFFRLEGLKEIKFIQVNLSLHPYVKMALTYK